MAVKSAREPRRDRLSRDTYLMVELVSRRLMAEVDQACRPDGLSEAQYAVLWVVCLADDPAGIVQGAISDGLLTRAADVSRIVGRLEEAGLVVRRRDSVDGRVLRVQPTARGREVFLDTTARVKALHRRQFHGLDDDELRTLTALLNRVFWGAEG